MENYVLSSTNQINGAAHKLAKTGLSLNSNVTWLLFALHTWNQNLSQAYDDLFVVFFWIHIRGLPQECFSRKVVNPISTLTTIAIIPSKRKSANLNWRIDI